MQPNEITARETRARQLHQQGYNCCQSVVMAFADLLPIPAEQALAMAAPFGRGLSGLKQTCGCVNGMAMVCGLCGQPQAVRPLGQRFQEEHGELNCFRLLQQQGQGHSCNDLVASAARLLAEVL
ncbi:MAG: C_GCAxxG_C_C family protein [Bacteroidales bacterium]|nr:C_GCAxxG_C_C family protein [Bacteroidales bacterium]